MTTQQAIEQLRNLVEDYRVGAYSLIEGEKPEYRDALQVALRCLEGTARQGGEGRD
jgi:hypothetical protein